MTLRVAPEAEVGFEEVRRGKKLKPELSPTLPAWVLPWPSGRMIE